MPLIDGKYEILRQRSSSDGRTLVHATDPDGRPVRIVWYEVASQEEGSFELYRRALRRLMRDDDVLLREVVSRPGARYVVWGDAEAAPAVPLDPAWRGRLERLGLPADGADLRRRGRGTVLAGLGWEGGDEPPAPGGAASTGPAAADAPHAPRRRLPRSLPPLGTTARTWLVGLLAALAAVALVLVGWTRSDNDAVVTVPELVGLPADQAAVRLADARLAVSAQALATGGAPGTAPGTVVATEPPAGTGLRPGRTVRIDYVLPRDGSATREVPSLTGRPLADAGERLRPAELRLGEVARVPARLPTGTVLAQRPAAGLRAAPGDAVHLVVSDGPRPRRSFLPDLVGRDLEEARELARLAGLPADRILVDPVATPDVPAGEVVGMTPAPWHPLRIDDVTLRLLVADPEGAGRVGEATGPGGERTVPDVVGLELAEARARLAVAGWTTEVARTSTAALPRAVVLQDPPPGAAGSGAVRLIVNAPPVPLPVPEPRAEILAPRLRWVPYRFLIEPGIPTQRAELRARSADGDVAVVTRREVAGGDVLEGSWPTLEPGPVTFELRLNGVPYAESRVTREVDGP